MKAPRGSSPFRPRRASPRISVLFPASTAIPAWRWLVWGAEALILLAVILYFLVLPNMRSRSVNHAASLPRPAVETPPPAPDLGKTPRVLPGLTPVPGALLAPLTGLAAGAAAARDDQVRCSRERGLPVEMVNGLGMRFRLVPPGHFLMGSPPGEAGRWDGEELHAVAIPRPFYLGVGEVTQAQWRAVMGKNPSAFQNPAAPVEEVTWYDAVRFLGKLCDREKVPLGRYRLPTEAEWEYACRAGTDTAYCFGDDPRLLDWYAEYAGNNDRAPVPAGRRLPNAFGFAEMHGNVWEWCQDKFAPYLPLPPGVPEPEEVGWRTSRGGNWLTAAPQCRSANRARLPPLSHGNMLGFRVLYDVID